MAAQTEPPNPTHNMSKEIENNALAELARRINAALDVFKRQKEEVAQTLAAMAPEAKEIGVLLESARDTLDGPVFYHWAREQCGLKTIDVDRFLRFSKSWDGGTPSLPAMKQLMLAAGNDYVDETDAPKVEASDVIDGQGGSVTRDVLAGWFLDAKRWWTRVQRERPVGTWALEDCEAAMPRLEVAADAYLAVQRRYRELKGVA
jgi:hypothetical protein